MVSMRQHLSKLQELTPWQCTIISEITGEHVTSVSSADESVSRYCEAAEDARLKAVNKQLKQIISALDKTRKKVEAKGYGGPDVLSETRSREREKKAANQDDWKNPWLQRIQAKASKGGAGGGGKGSSIFSKIPSLGGVF